MNACTNRWAPLPHVSVGGIKVALATRAELTAAMVADCRTYNSGEGLKRARLVFDTNGHAISLARTDPAYRAAMDRADVIHADGGSVVLASKYLSGGTVGDRSVTTDLIHDFAHAAEREGLSFYLLGATEEVNAACAKRLSELYPHLRIVGRHHGYFQRDEEHAVISDIRQCAPDLLWVGLSKPREQTFAADYCERLNAAWVITCGGCFNYITGHYGRAPVWMQRNNLEWLYRAVTNPKKLLGRYLTTTPHALWTIATKIDKRLFRDGSDSANTEIASR